jgi:hypothetical protein
MFGRAAVLKLLVFLLCDLVLAGPRGVQLLSVDEFKHIATELSQKVNLFADVWRRRRARFDADIIRYPYKTRAYVVKNAAVLERPVGYKNQINVP